MELLLFVSKRSDLPKRLFICFPVEKPTGKPLTRAWEPRPWTARREVGLGDKECPKSLSSVNSLSSSRQAADGRWPSRAHWGGPRVTSPCTQDNVGWRRLEKASRAGGRRIASLSEAPPGWGARYDVGIRSLKPTQGSTPAWLRGRPVDEEGGSPDTCNALQKLWVPMRPFQNIILSL